MKLIPGSWVGLPTNSSWECTDSPRVLWVGGSDGAQWRYCRLALHQKHGLPSRSLKESRSKHARNIFPLGMLGCDTDQLDVFIRYVGIKGNHGNSKEKQTIRDLKKQRYLMVLPLLHRSLSSILSSVTSSRCNPLIKVKIGFAQPALQLSPEGHTMANWAPIWRRWERGFWCKIGIHSFFK